ncbi:MAG: peptidoglycan bridge formation glycyltransferase FemA/FemB family protein, partial [Methanomassiliicoccales archaeon]
IDGFTRQEAATLVINLTQDLDVIWKNMNKTCKNLINKAMRQKIVVRLSENYEEFYKMLTRFRKKKGLSGLIERFDVIRKYGTLFVAEFDRKTLAGNIYLEDDNNIRWWIGASKRLDVDKNMQKMIGDANRLLIWEAMKYAKEKGIKEFDMGGYYTGGDKNDPTYTINIFKQGFGGELTMYYTYERDYSKIHRFVGKFFRLKQALF